MRAAQKTLFEHFAMKETKKRYARTRHEGAKPNGKRKQERPLSTKRWIHLVLKSEKARGRLSQLTAQNRVYIDKTSKEKAKRFGVKIAESANVGTHLHLSGFSKP